jgi:hypothetical protein
MIIRGHTGKAGDFAQLRFCASGSVYCAPSISCLCIITDRWRYPGGESG